jgi:hypothetical protein
VTDQEPTVALERGEINPETRPGETDAARARARRGDVSKSKFDGTVYTRQQILENMAGAISNELERPVQPADIAGGLHLKGYWDTGATVDQAVEATLEYMEREVTVDAGR